ncbi:MAG: hypothetical protein HZA54_11240 [Planctomycetes bacterium]|nr:hypothetical protein [Planctomycetota bacterium]
MPLSTITRLPQTLRNIQRVRQILQVIARHGFGDIAYRLDIDSYLGSIASFLKFQRHARSAAIFTTFERIRMALEELGPTFIKFGQILATRPDLVPMPLILELRKLQDKVPPFSAAEARAQIEQELKAPLDGIFASFNPTPLAAGSIGQVHEARLRDERRVVVKVQRPGLERSLATDLDILNGLAQLVEANIPEVKSYNPVGMVDEFARSIRKEIDFTREAYHVRRFGQSFGADPRIHVLYVHENLTTERVLVMEFVEGIKISNLEALDRAGCNRKLIAKNGVEFVLKQIFEDGFFHGDPHPGNLFVLPGNVIAPIDYGMMGVLDEARRYDLLMLLLGIVGRDMDTLVKLFRRLELISDQVNVAALRTDAADLVERYYGVELQRMDMGKFFTQLFEILNRHHVKIPPDILLMGKSLATIDGIARMLDPELDIVASIRPFVFRLYLKHLTDTRRIGRELLGAGEDYLSFARTVPSEVQQTISRLRKGQLEVQLNLERLEDAVSETNRSANRVSTGLLISAVTMASASLLAGTGSGPTLRGVPLTQLLGTGGLLLASALSVMLFFAILRSGGIGRS